MSQLHAFLASACATLQSKRAKWCIHLNPLFFLLRLIHHQVFKKSINATLATGHAVAGLIAPVIKRNREAASSLDDLHNQSPTKASAHMYSLAADVLGGAAGVQIPIKLNKSASSCAQQQSAPVIDVSLTAEQELLIKMTLGLVWAHITSQGASSQRMTNAAEITSHIAYLLLLLQATNTLNATSRCLNPWFYRC